MDALSELLKTIHLIGSVYCRSELSAPWGMALPTSDAARFHVVRRGRCRLRFDQGSETPPILLEAGDVVLLPKGDFHILSDDIATPAEPLMELLTRHLPPDTCGPLTFGGGGEKVTLICGYFQFDTGVAHPLLSVLPKVLSVHGNGGRAHSWLESTLDLIAEEAGVDRPGSESLINRLTEALFIQVVRAHIEEETHAQASWLAGLSDPKIARVLGFVHREPHVGWTVDTLASRAGMSRSAFSQRFRDLVGEPPLQYLTRWRMHVAATRIREGQMSLAQVAEAVGYEAEAGFSRVFKRMIGVSPGAYRRL
jgi:AraC-like DNA-binding protein